MTEYADEMAKIVRQIHPELKTAGFRKRRHTFNRSVEDGVVQVVNFQMGPKEPPGAEPIPPFRLDLYGLFTVNLGVAVEEAWEQMAPSGEVFPGFLNDYDCQLRVRLGHFMDRAEDVWWSLDEPSSADRVSSVLLGPGLDWLSRRGTRAAILDLFQAGGREALPTPTDLPVVMILRRLERIDDADEVLRSYYDSCTNRPAHRRYVYELAQSLGLDGLTPP